MKEGVTSIGQQLARLCGSNLPEPIITDRGALWIRYKTTDASSRNGVSLSYEVIA